MIEIIMWIAIVLPNNEIKLERVAVVKNITTCQLMAQQLNDHNREMNARVEFACQETVKS